MSKELYIKIQKLEKQLEQQKEEKYLELIDREQPIDAGKCVKLEKGYYLQVMLYICCNSNLFSFY